MRWLAICALLAVFGCDDDDDDGGGSKGAAVLGQITVELDASERTVRTGESLVGNLVTDALRAAWPDAQVALVNAGGLRFDDKAHADGKLPAGDYTQERLVELLPFGNTVTLVTMTGAQIQSVLEHGVNALNGPMIVDDTEARGWFLAPSGLTYAVDTSAQREVFDADANMVVTPGERIVELKIDGADVDPAGTYRVATIKYIADGGDGHLAFGEGTDRVDQEALLLDAVINYLTENTPVTPTIDGRIEIR